MKTFKQYITEAKIRRWEVSTGQPKLTVLESPSASDIMEFAKNAKEHHARFIINEKGTMWLWDAYDEWHDAMASYLSVYGFLGKSYEMVQGDVSYLDGVKTWVVNIIRVDKKPFDKKNKPLQQIKKIIKPMKHSSWAVGSNI